MILQTSVSSIGYGLYIAVGIAALVVGAAGTLAFRNAYAKSTVAQLNQLLTATNLNFARVDADRLECRQEITKLAGHLEEMREMVTQRAEVEKLAGVEMTHHTELMVPLKRLVEIAEATAGVAGVTVPKSKP